MAFEISAPHHASTPVWASKDLLQKQMAVTDMAINLAAFSARLGGSPTRRGTPAHAQWCEAYRLDLLAQFATLLEPGRAALLEDLRHAVPADEAEASDIAKITELLMTHPDFPTVGCETGHVTGSALIVNIEEGAVLLHRHRKLNRWFQFGGHPDFELDMLSVARREAREESGIADLALLTSFMRERTPVGVDLQDIPASAARPRHLHADYRYVFAVPHLRPSVSGGDESDDFWVLGFEEALSTSDDVIERSVKRLIAKAQRLSLAARDRAGRAS